MDGMERIRKENSARDKECRRDKECKRKDCDPPLKMEGHTMLGSPVVIDSGRSSWPECPTKVFLKLPESNRFNGGLTPLAGSEPPCSSSCPENDTRLMVGELTTKNYRIPDMTMVRSPNSRAEIHSKQGQWQHLYQLAGGSKSNSQHGGYASQDNDKLMFNVREDLKRMPSNFRDQKFLPSKRTKQNPEEISAHLTHGYNKIISSKTLHVGATESKVLPTSCLFPHFSVKKTVKGKEVASSNQDALAGSGVATMYEKDEILAKINGVTFDGMCYLTANNINPEPPDDGISLRNLLKPGCCRLTKVESMHVFKKIVELVGFAHCQGVALQDLRPSCFILLSSNMVKYTGQLPQIEIQDDMYHKMNKKMSLEKDEDTYQNLGQQEKFSENTESPKLFQFTSKCGFRNKSIDGISTDISHLRHLSNTENKAHKNFSYRNAVMAAQQQSNFVEKKWYATPEDVIDNACTFAANIYSLGVLLFELLCCFESWETHSAVMLDLQRRIFPPKMLSEYPIEAGFCLWLLHPDPSSRPTIREVLQSELFCGSQELNTGEDLLPSFKDEDGDSEMLLYLLTIMKEQKHKHASKLEKDLVCLEADIKDVKRRNSLSTSLDSSCSHKGLTNSKEQGFHLDDFVSSGGFCKPISESKMYEAKLIRSIGQLENAYFSMRCQTQHADANVETRSDKDLLKNREILSQVTNENAKPCMDQEPADRLGSFFESVCKYACYTKLEECGTLRNGDLLNSSNVICSLSVDRDDDYIAAAGVSKKIKIFECTAFLNNAIDIHYPVVEMSNKSKLSCVCWNNYIKNYLASTDYDGIVQMWDANTGQGFSQYTEHQKRAWSVDFSQIDPMKFASGSDDCSVKLWSINEKNSTSSIGNPANVCCVQFSAYSSHLLAFGSADYKIYCYDLRHTRIPWCTLAGHGKTVSYVRFVDSDTLVSASTDNTLKLWDLNKTNPAGLSSGACSLSFSGHTNEKNFVGLSALDGYIACGSESNEVFTYYRSLPMPITSCKFRSIDPISGHEIADDSQFVSSICWRRKSNMIVAANSTGIIKILQMV